MPASVVKILLFEDNNSLRQSLRQLIEAEPGFVVFGDFPNAENAKEFASQLQPDVAVMDIDMPGADGIEGIQAIKTAKPDTQIIMHTVFEDADKLFACLCAGANGYLLKKHSPLRIIEAIHDVQQGGAPMSPEIARMVLQSFHQPARSYHLTPREKEVLQWLVKGYSYKMIASACNISLETVKSYLKNIYAKLQVNCGTEAVAKAMREKVV